MNHFCNNLKPGETAVFLLLAMVTLTFIMLPAPSLALSVNALPDHSALTDEEITIVGTVGDNVTELAFKGKNAKLIGDPIIDKGGFHLVARLKYGESQIILGTSAGEAITINLYRLKEGEPVPAAYKRHFNHATPLAVDNCDLCHRGAKKAPDYKRIYPKDTGCQESGCHDIYGQAKYVHGPIASGQCITCHTPHGDDNPMSLTRKGLELCNVCHEDMDRIVRKENIHQPVKDGDCIGCHDSHQSDNNFMLKAVGQPLCEDCHTLDFTKRKNLHGPMSTGDCDACHAPHASANETLLREPKLSLCLSCHEEMEEKMQRDVKHPPADEDCMTCHDPHSSDKQFFLNSIEVDTCNACHSEFIDEVKMAAVQHKPVKDGSCSGCHNPHASDAEHLIKGELMSVCFECHADLAEEVKGNKYMHGPVDQSDCTGCHMPHGSANPFVLLEYYPEEFYTPYGEEKYALCFECHERDISLDPKTTELTNFRNGEVNMHYLHVNRQKGRSCKACHAAHASSQQKHVRLEVPFGKQWSYPIEFTKMENGGSCVVGCHKPKDYDRINPVKY
jgi:predicted CXXCH cytochrome family protein